MCAIPLEVSCHFLSLNTPPMENTLPQTSQNIPTACHLYLFLFFLKGKKENVDLSPGRDWNFTLYLTILLKRPEHMTHILSLTLNSFQKEKYFKSAWHQHTTQNENSQANGTLAVLTQNLVRTPIKPNKCALYETLNIFYKILEKCSVSCSCFMGENPWKAAHVWSTSFGGKHVIEGLKP